MKKGLPKLTALQFLILRALLLEEKTSEELQSMLRQHNINRSPVAFYQLMARLEKAKYVTKIEQDGKNLYSLRLSGNYQLKHTVAFYR